MLRILLQYLLPLLLPFLAYLSTPGWRTRPAARRCALARAGRGRRRRCWR